MPVQWTRKFIKTTNYDFTQGVYKNIFNTKPITSVTGRVWELDDWKKSGRTPSKTDYISIEMKENCNTEITVFQEFASNLHEKYPGREIKFVIAFDS
jgi:hypothetical protein